MIADEIFKKFDNDHSGTIDKEEAKLIFIDIMKKMHFTKLDVSDETLEHWFKIADTNGDNQISKDEAESFVKNHLR